MPDDAWSTVATVALTTSLVYLAVLVGVRLAGRRTLAEMSAFDFVVTVALGSATATTAVADGTGVLRGVVAIAVLLLLQVLVGAARRRWPRFRTLVDFAPVVLAAEGRTRAEGLKATQLTETDLESKLRQQGVFDLERVVVAILEPTGGLSVLERRDDHAEPQQGRVRP